MAHASRPIPARRMYVEPRRVLFDSDLGSYSGHPDDPRFDGPNVCPECGGCKRGPTGDLCDFCHGTGTYWEDE